MDADELAQALVAHAAAYLPGEKEIDFGSVRDLVFSLAEDPKGKPALDTALAQVNDPETVTLVKSLVRRVAADADHDARTNANSTSVVLQPWQAAFMALTGANIVGVAAGTLSLAFALPVGALLATGVGLTSWMRSRTSRAENDLRRRTELVKALL